MAKKIWKDNETGGTPIYADDLNRFEDKVDLIKLLDVINIAPTECSKGDRYYNTTDKKIYTATGTNVWGTTGETPETTNLYLNITDGKHYYYDGTDLKTYEKEKEVFIGSKTIAPTNAKLVIEETENHKSLSGTEISITDGIDSPVKRLRQYGITKQNSYSGKNLQDVNEGTLSGTDAYYLNSATPLEITSDMVGKYLSYSFDINITSLTTESTMMYYNIGYGNTKGAFSTVIKQVSYSSITTGTYNCKLEGILITEAMVGKFITIRYLGFGAPSTFEATYSNAQLEFSETSTEYEPYVGGTTSPSPNYPQEIEVATGSVSVKSTGKNLWNMDNPNATNGYYTINGTFVDTTTLATKYKCNIFNCVEGDTFVKSGDGWGGIITFWNDDTFVNGINNTKCTIPSGINNVRFSCNITSTNAQLEKGEVATDYEPYKESSITYDLGDNFLADKDYIENGVLNKNVGKLVLDGSENWFLGGKGTNQIFGLAVDYIGYPLVSNMFTYYTSFTILLENIGISTNLLNNRIGIANGVSNTLAEFKTWLSENPVTVYYELTTPKQIQLETTGELRTFEPNTIITNSLDSEMEVDYNTTPNVNMYYRNSNGNFNKVYM